MLVRFLDDHGFDVYGNLGIQWIKAVSGQEWNRVKDEILGHFTIKDAMVTTYETLPAKKERPNLTLMDLRDYYNLILRQFETFITYQEPERDNFGQYKEKREIFACLHNHIIMQRVTCMCGQCPEAEDYFQRKPCPLNTV